MSKLSEEEKERLRQADLEELKRATLEKNHSDPERQGREVVPEVRLVSPDLENPETSPVPEQPDSGTSQEQVETPEAVPMLKTMGNEEFFTRLREYRRPARGFRRSVRVTDEAFSAVTHCALTHSVNKSIVLSFLLTQFLPRSQENVAEYLTSEPKNAVRERDLTFFEPPELADRLEAVCTSVGIPKTYLIENLILHHLPGVTKIYPPRRALRRRGG